MGCGTSSKNEFMEVEADIDSKIKYYKNQSIGSFNREMILCYGCKKSFNLGSNLIKLNCSLCNNFFHCNIGGECIGKKCLFKIGEIGEQTIRARYCKDCSIYKGYNKCICNNCNE